MDPTTRFTDRAVAYHSHRPRYPRKLISLLQADAGLSARSVIADIGSGTGILTELFLENGNVVHAVEPNAAMREIAEQNLAANPRFHSVAATAEATRLANASVDFIVAGQAFHWFDRPRAKTEFCRILRPGGWIVLVWNERLTNSSPFAAAYERVLLEHSIDYSAMDPKKVSSDIEAMTSFLGPQCRHATAPHSARSSFDQLAGLLASASYAPLPGHAKYDGMIRSLRSAFDAHAEHGTVQIDYEMKAYYAPVCADR